MNKKQSNNWKIYPIEAGLFGPMPDAYKYRGGEANKGSLVPSIIYLIKNENNIILVDTSFSNAQEIKQKMKISCERNKEIGSLLSANGTCIEKIDAVILTHLHWDHAGSIDLFKKVPIYCQYEDYKWMSKRYEWEIGYPPWFTDSFFKRKYSLNFIKGDAEIYPGIKVWLCGGHTPGSQMVSVETDKGCCVITGDNVMVYKNVLNTIPVGLFCNINECIKSIERVKKNSNFFIPSHDWKVFENIGNNI